MHGSNVSCQPGRGSWTREKRASLGFPCDENFEVVIRQYIRDEMTDRADTQRAQLRFGAFSAASINASATQRVVAWTSRSLHPQISFSTT